MKITLVGFYGEGNLGDDAILKAIINNTPSNVNIKITSGKLLKNENTIKRRGFLSWPAYIKSVLNSDKVLFSGGILQDWSIEGVTFFALRIIAAEVLGKKTSLWGAGVGPIHSDSMKSLVKKTLKHIDVAWVRDKYSLNLYNSLSTKNCIQGTDWSWFYNVPYPKNKIKDSTLINLRPWKHKLKTLDDLIQTNNDKKYVGLAARNEDINALKKTFKPDKILQPISFEDLLNICSFYDNGIAMRYHIALAMLRSKLSTTLIPYDMKVKELLQYQSNLDSFIMKNELLFNQMVTNYKNYLSN